MNIYQILGSVGNLEDYKHEIRKVIPSGLVKTSSLVLKMYDMITEKNPVNPVKDAKEFLEKEINEGKINPLIGIGFTILSKDMLNVALWNSDCPIVLNNQLYGYTNFPQDVRRLDINKDGSFCIWELGIVNHEKNAWKEYLTSQRTNEDKKRYLDNFIEGDL